MIAVVKVLTESEHQLCIPSPLGFTSPCPVSLPTNSPLPACSRYYEAFSYIHAFFLVPYEMETFKNLSQDIIFLSFSRYVLFHTSVFNPLYFASCMWFFLSPLPFSFVNFITPMCIFEQPLHLLSESEFFK